MKPRRGTTSFTSPGSSNGAQVQSGARRHALCPLDLGGADMPRRQDDRAAREKQEK
jgi:hypothetical protein